MRTAVQLRPRTGDDEGPRTEVLGGTPSCMRLGALGPVALFESGEIVAYLLRCRRRVRVFVFRTLDVDDRLAATVPGVSPRVQLLLELRTAGRIRIARGLFAYLSRTGRDPSALPDAFYVRVGAVLGGRLPGHKVLRSLLASPCRSRLTFSLPERDHE
jgi:hypothetical protein